jgi:NodT family efflux transporter outer membrane factor (OMF) lipoprotein
MSIRRYRFVLFLPFFLALTSCIAVGPDYQPPQMELPSSWSDAQPTEDTATQPAEATELRQWWREMNDPLLNELVNEALAANLDLATAKAQLREARARRALARAQLGPSLSVAASASRSYSSGESGAGTTKNLYNAGFDASWEADVFGGLRRGREAASADLEASVENLRDTQVSLVAEVALNYAELRTAQHRLTITEERIASFEETLQVARWRRQAGLVSELDVAQARTELENTRAGLPSLRTSATEARNRLAVLLGRAPGELQPRLTATAIIPMASRAAMVGIPADILRQRPDVRGAERKLAAQTARLGEAKGERYPSFKLSGSIGLEALTASALTNSGATLYSLLGSITAPIFDSGRISANIETQDALLEQARLYYQATVLSALEEVENALVAVTNNSERRHKLAQAADSARETLLLAEQRYAGGLTDFLTVLDSQRTLLKIEDDLASGTGELTGAQIRLFKTLGGGWSPASPTTDSENAS